GITTVTVTLEDCVGVGMAGEESNITVSSDRNKWITVVENIPGGVDDFEGCATPADCGWTQETGNEFISLCDILIGPGPTTNYACLRQNGGISKLVDTSGYRNIQITYQVYTENLVTGNFGLEVSTDGGFSWIPVTSSTLSGNNPWTAEGFNLSSINDDVENNPQFTIRFAQDATGLAEYSAVDDVVVTGDPLEDVITLISSTNGVYTYEVKSCYLSGQPDNKGPATLCAIWDDLVNDSLSSFPCAAIFFKAPVLTIADPAAGVLLGSNDDSIPGGNFQYTVTATTDAPDGSTAVLTVDSNTQDAQVSGGNVTFTDVDFPEGGVTLSVEVTNKDCDDTGSDSVVVTVDITAPAVTITLPVAGSTLDSTTVEVKGTAADANGIDRVEVNGEVASGGVSWVVSVAGLAEGLNTLTATAWDNAGNWSSTSIQVFIDSTPPDPPTITSPLSGPTSDNTPLVLGTVALADAGSTVEIYEGMMLWGSTQAVGTNFSLTLPALADGSHILTAKAIDGAGNKSGPSAGVTIFVDTREPDVEISTPASGSIYGTDCVVVSGSVTDLPPSSGLDAGVVTAGVVTASISGQTWTVTVCGLSEGSVTIDATYRDLAGNEGVSAPVNITVDTTPPTVSITEPTDGWTFIETTIVVTGSASDAATDIDRVEVNSQTAFGTDNWMIMVSGLTQGPNPITAIAWDVAGNQSTPTVISVFVDTVPPQLAITSPTSGSVVGTDWVIITGTVSDPDPSCGQPGEVTVSLTGPTSGSTIAPVVAGVWAATFYGLTDGIYNASASAADQCGNGVSILISFTVETICLDSTDPLINITSPSDGVTLYVASFPTIVVVGGDVIDDECGIDS
ncbi:MAG: hypothetical protein JSU92_04440, partial [Deltaproteobacteria bacterium]